jgi:hypothetical protein
MYTKFNLTIRRVFICLILVASVANFVFTGCGKVKSKELYHRFPDKSWSRFNLLSFEIPVDEANMYNVYLFATFTPDYIQETLDFNMVMNTSSGEERINEYQLEVKTTAGKFCFPCNSDTCTGTILLKKDLNLSRPGILKIEIENLTPRLATLGVMGVGVRLVPSGK